MAWSKVVITANSLACERVEKPRSAEHLQNLGLVQMAYSHD